MHDAHKNRLLDAASAPYKAARFSDYRWARGKLSGDPVFPALLERRVFADNTRVLDLGCGRGLLAAWLLAAECLAAQDESNESISPPRGLRFRGVELSQQTATRSNAMLQAIYGERVELSGGDMRSADMRDVDAVAILDALHYISHADQERLLDRIRAALNADGLFVTRVGDASGGWRFDFSQVVDRCVASLHHRRYVSTWCRPLAMWRTALESRGFHVQVVPMSSGTFFANFLLICRVL